MELTTESPKKKGRSKGSGTYKVYKWQVMMYDKETNTFKEGKFCSIAHINQELGLKLNGDLTHRIQTKYRADMTMRNKDNSFLKRWGHIHLTKIHEPVPEDIRKTLVSRLTLCAEPSTDPSLEQFSKNPKVPNCPTSSQISTTCEPQPHQNCAKVSTSQI